MNNQFHKEGERLNALCEDGAFCEDFGCASFIELAAVIRARHPARPSGPPSTAAPTDQP